MSLQPLGARFEKAMTYAFHTHARQLRKGTGVPYVAHLLGVAALVLEDGGGEDEVIAALLHDAVEDQGGQERLLDIERHFGKDVAKIVAACSDADITPKPPWRQRKEAYLEHLATAPPEVLRVSLADKLYNARAIVFDYRRLGEKLWVRFDPTSDQLWYYRSLLDVYRRVSDSSLVDELGRVVGELEGLMSRNERS
jgi:GTP pyrophosphokinase